MHKESRHFCIAITPRQATTVVVFMILCVWHTEAQSLGVEPSRGRQELLQWGLQLQAHPQDNLNVNISTYLSANFTTLNLEGQQSANLLSQLPPGALFARWSTPGSTGSVLSADQANYVNRLASVQYGDEITNLLDPNELATLAAQYTLSHTQYPNALAFTSSDSNSYTRMQLATYMQATQPDMLSFDYYPGFSFSTSSRNTWYSIMQTYRTAALAGNDGTGQQPIPYGQYLDLYRSSYSAPLPSESFVRLQQFASWAFGYTFTGAFIYNGVSSVGLDSVMFSSDGETSPTPVFGYVAESNRESENLGPALVRLVSTDIRMIPGSGHSVSGTGITAWAPGANNGNDYLTSITPTVSQGGANSTSYSDTLIGYFKPLLANNSDYPFANGTHFMIVNGASQGTAAAAAQWYHLTFNFGSTGFNSLEEVSRDTGQILTIPLTHLSGSTYALDINLPGGTGDLFQYSFVGGDLNGDGVVNLSDYAILMSHWMQATNGTPSSGDLNGDGKVDLADFGLFKLAYESFNGGGSDLTAPVPEPGALVLLASGLVTSLVICQLRRSRDVACTAISIRLTN